MQDVLGGHVPVLAAGLGSMYAQHEQGKLVVLAVTDPKRSTIAKEIPTSGESGFPELLTTSVFVVLAPAGTHVFARIPNSALDRRTVQETSRSQDTSALF